jgi:putative ABC transport system ATP-binding protein
MRDINRQEGKTVLVVTHNAAIARLADTILRLRSGAIVSRERNERPAEPEELSW